jgi:hypothetical protein
MRVCLNWLDHDGRKEIGLGRQEVVCLTEIWVGVSEKDLSKVEFENVITTKSGILVTCFLRGHKNVRCFAFV